MGRHSKPSRKELKRREKQAHKQAYKQPAKTNTSHKQPKNTTPHKQRDKQQPHNTTNPRAKLTETEFNQRSATYPNPSFTSILTDAQQQWEQEQHARRNRTIRKTVCVTLVIALIAFGIWYVHVDGLLRLARRGINAIESHVLGCSVEDGSCSQKFEKIHEFFGQINIFAR